MPPRVLFLYSSPPGLDRARLDLEYRDMDRVLKDSKLPPETVSRHLAVSVDDLPGLLCEHEYEILHFSGHGSPDGIYLETDHEHPGTKVSARRLAAAIRSAHRPKAMVLMCCYSADAISSLLDVAPYLVTVTGEARDKACRAFADEFYREYFASGDVERAFGAASNRLEYRGLDRHIQLSLTTPTDNPAGPKYLVVSMRRDGKLRVDVSPVERQLARLPEGRDRFLSDISRKIAVHLYVFTSPSPPERALIPAGMYVVELSWQGPDKPVVCHRILPLKPRVAQVVRETWAELLVQYNHLYAQRYRYDTQAGPDKVLRSMQNALVQFRYVLKMLRAPAVAKSLRRQAPGPYTVALAMLAANVTGAEQALTQDESSEATTYLEAALTALHDLVNALNRLNIKPARGR